MIEDFRRAVAAATFDSGEDSFDLTVGICATEVGECDDTETLFKRLDRLIEQAQKEGVNQMVVDSSEGTVFVEESEDIAEYARVIPLE